MKAYKVECETTNALWNTTYGPNKGKGIGDAYRECRDGVLYVITDDPRKIYNEFPLTKSIEEIGIGYVFI